MNEYLTERRTMAEQFKAEVAAIAAHLDGTILPDPDNLDYPPTWFKVGFGDSDPFRLFFQPGRTKETLHVSVADWPTYHDENNRLQCITPLNLYPREEYVGTTARRDRDPKKIAAQINRAVIVPGRELYERCAARMREAQEYATNSTAAFHRLAAALGDDNSKAPERTAYIYVRNIAGDSFHVEYRSPGDVLLRGLPVDDVIVMLDALRTHRRTQC